MTDKKALGLWTALALVVGNMVGVGAYLVPASLGALGPISLGGWVVTGAGAMCLALAFARMGRIMPAEGGPYAYTREAFGDLPAFLVAWGYWVSVWIGNAAIATALVGSLTPFFPMLGSSPPLMAAAALAPIWLLTALNVWGVREAAIFQLVTTLIKVVPLIVFATLGLFYIDVSNFTPINVSGGSSFSAITASAVLLLWGLMGFESATVPADEVENPERTIPTVTVLGMGVTAVIYMLSTVAIMGVMSASELAGSTAPFAEAAKMIWGDWAGTIVAVAVVVAAFGVLNGWVLMQGQMPLAPARDGLFPRPFGRLSKRGTPAFGLILSSGLCTLLVATNYTRGLLGLFEFALLLATVTVVVAYAGAAAAHVVLIRRHPGRWGGADARRAVVVSTLGFLYSCFVIVWAGWEPILWGGVLLAGGLPLYLWSVRRYHGPVHGADAG